jgi:hypothetical protein
MVSTTPLFVSLNQNVSSRWLQFYLLNKMNPKNTTALKMPKATEGIPIIIARGDKNIKT